MKKIICIILSLMLLLPLVSCNKQKDDNSSSSTASSLIEIDDKEYDFVLESNENGVITYKDETNGKTSTLNIYCNEGTENAYTLDGTTLTFKNFNVDSIYSISGEFYGNIVIENTADLKFELELNGATITSSSEAPICAGNFDKFTLSAKKETVNKVCDLRTTALEYASAIYSECDMSIEGKGTLEVYSKAFNGIHTKDDLTIKNLVLNVDSLDTAVKGNDSVTIESGNLTLISRESDGIKTKNTDISSKGKQRGIVTISGGIVTIYAGKDGIDAAYDLVIDETNATLNLNVYTGEYSEYSSLSSNTNTQNQTVPNNNNNGTIQKMSVDSSSISAWGGPGGGGGFNPGGQGGGFNPGGGGGGGFGPGGMEEGNKNKLSYSAKGLKAGNSITINGGTILVNSSDDCLHASSDTLDSGETTLGNIVINGGTFTLKSGDDGIHADNILNVVDGNIKISTSYEGLEGFNIVVDGGKISVISTDDGFNATASSGQAIKINGGEIYIFAGGDGIDSNSKTSYAGIVFSGGKTVVISTGNADSGLDTESGYKYNSGYVIAMSTSGGMSSENTQSSPAFSSIGVYKNITLKNGNYLIAKGVGCVKMPTNLTANVVVLGSTSTSISSATSSSDTFDENGVSWYI